MTTTYSPNYLNCILKAEIMGFLEDYEVEIAESYDEAQSIFIDALRPLWEAQRGLSESMKMLCASS